MIDIKAIDFGIEDLGSNTDFDNYLWDFGQIILILRAGFPPFKIWMIISHSWCREINKVPFI